MCLKLSITESERMREEIRGGRTTFYKVYGVQIGNSGREAFAPCQGNVVTPDTDGFVVSNRGSANLSSAERIGLDINHGIHCYCTEETAEAFTSMDEFHIPVVVSVDDFVGTNANATEAVFTRIKIDVAKLKELLSSTDLECQDDDDDYDDDDDWDDEDEYDDDWDDEDEAEAL
jgi:hypothetical protein